MSQLSTTSNSIMGGRNEQVQNRQSSRAAAVTTQRLIRSTTPQDAKLWSEPPTNTVADNECDTNADMCCLGKNFIVLNATYRTADVYAYNASIKPIKKLRLSQQQQHTMTLFQGTRSSVFFTSPCIMCEHITMTSPHPWNHSEVIMVQAMAQGGSPIMNPWKRCLAIGQSILMPTPMRRFSI